jgi:hypothetical protein
VSNASRHLKKLLADADLRKRYKMASGFVALSNSALLSTIPTPSKDRGMEYAARGVDIRQTSRTENKALRLCSHGVLS